MYRKAPIGQLSFENFYLPFGGKLSGENRWVKLAELVPWEQFESEYAKQFSEGQGAPAKSFRIALGALIIVDQIYRTRSNRAYCRNLGIRITAPPLGRPVPDDLAAIRKQTLADAKVRNQIEGKFGQAKRRFSLNRVMTKLANTSETAIAITFLVMNLEALLKQLAFLFFAWFMLCRQYLILQFGKIVLSFSEISCQFRRFPVLPLLWSPFSTCLLPAS